MSRLTQRLIASALGLVLALPLLTGACARQTDEAPVPSAVAVTVKEVNLGRSVGGDNRITDKTDTFKPNDVIYASVVTSGSSSSSVVKARWTFDDGQVVEELEQTIAPAGEAATEFHISKPDGWPEGTYHLEVFLDGVPVERKDFQVKQS